METLLCPGYIKQQYPIYLSSDKSFRDILSHLPKTNKRYIVIDEKVAGLYPALLDTLQENEGECFIVRITATEDHKDFSSFEKLCSTIFETAPSRDDIIIGVGGGMVLNLAGLAGSLIMRGIRFYYIPTTFTAQIDASIGSKQAVNFKNAKNWIGTYNDPEFCYVNTHFISTLSQRDASSQAIEGVKLLLATEEDSSETVTLLSDFRSLNNQALLSIIKKLITAKIKVLEIDLMEDNYGMCMLYGHTLGHAIEMLDHAHINHGEAVGLGMLAAARISWLMGYADESLVQQHFEILENLGLPTTIPSHIHKDELHAKLKYNKKNYMGKVRFVLLNKPGRMLQLNAEDFFTTIPDDVVMQAIEMGYQAKPVSEPVKA